MTAIVPGYALRVTLAEPPSANRWWRSTVIPAKHNKPARTLTYLSEEAREYKAYVAKASGGVVLTGPVRLSIEWYRGRAAGDLDKRIGVVLDALQGVFYANDAQIVELRARRFDDKGKARVVVMVEAVGEQMSILELEKAHG